MIVTRKFISRIDEESGIFGWLPKGMEFANATNGLGVAHDTMEHLDLRLDILCGEILALGAGWYLRYQNGWTGVRRHSRPLREYDYFMSIGSSLRDAWHEEHQTGVAPRWPLKDPGNIPSIDEIWGEDVDLHALAVKGYKAFREEMAYERDDKEEEPQYEQESEETIRRIHHWLRLGYRMAARRYRHCDIYSWMLAFDRISIEADKMLEGTEEIEDIVMTIRMDTRNGIIRMHTDRDPAPIRFDLV